jgi:hypothetical protein
MTALYDAKAQSVVGNCATCRVTLHYRFGGRFPPSRTLALCLLRDSLTNSASTLWQEMIDTGHDEEWNRGNVGRFICCVGVSDPFNWPERDWEEEEEDKSLPEATYAITVTDPQFLAHLTPGMAWDSTAYDHDAPMKFDAAWRTSDVLALARGINNDLAVDRMPILADALQDAGCDSDDLLSHLRDTTATHVRGCWALDLVLGKL